LDYGVPSLTRYLGQARAFIARDVPVALWAASVGPFSAAPDIERAVVHDLRRFSDISVRESASLRYLQSLGLDNVRQVVDPAFLMSPLPWDCSAVFPTGRDDGVLGFNVSPLVHKIVQRKGPAAGQAFEQGIVGFLRHVVETSGLGVVLVPHVDSVDGGAGNSDFLYMRDLLARSGLDERRITLAPRDLNAAQLKHLIGQCRFFIGARTHATIAAWSQHVPTVSLGYSVKARGLNADLFGDERFVLDTQALDARKLCSAFDLLRAEEDSTRAMLKEVIPTWQQRAHDAMPLSWKGQTT
jgi:polysaccharide pyruvyl transferase WcaK-like protein